MEKPRLCKVGIHEWKYFDWPEDLTNSRFVLGAPWRARVCIKCLKFQIPEHDCSYEYLGDWHWTTIEELVELLVEESA